MWAPPVGEPFGDDAVVFTQRLQCRAHPLHQRAQMLTCRHRSAAGLPGESLEEEFADVLAWLCTLANISDINLTDAVTRKYLGNAPPAGHK